MQRNWENGIKTKKKNYAKEECQTIFDFKSFLCAYINLSI